MQSSAYISPKVPTLRGGAHNARLLKQSIKVGSLQSKVSTFRLGAPPPDAIVATQKQVGPAPKAIGRPGSTTRSR
jgi:hypothetical protein